MKYKHERRSKTKSKSSKLDRRKLKKFLKQEGISSLEALVMLDSSLTSRANGRKHRDSRRTDSAKHFQNSFGSSKSHDRQSNGRKRTKSRTERKRRKKSNGKSRESPDYDAPHTSKLHNGHRKQSTQSSSSSSASPSKKATASDGKKETEAFKLIRKRLENMESDSNANAKSGRSREAKRQSTTTMDSDTMRDTRYAESSGSLTPDDKHASSKMFKKLSDSFAQYLLENQSSNSLDSSSVSDSEDANNSENFENERTVGHESVPTIILLDSDDEKNQATNANESSSGPPTTGTPTKTTPTRTTPTPIRTTPTRLTPTRTTSPTPLDNDHHIRVSNIKKEKKARSPKVYRKNHRTITSHHIQQNERVNSPSSADEDQSYTESANSSESPENLISYNNYAYVAKSKRRKKLRPPKLMRKIRQRPVPAEERMKTKQTALSFDVTEVFEPHANREMRESRDYYDICELRESREYHEDRDYREDHEYHENHEFRAKRDFRDNHEYRESLGNRKFKENREKREFYIFSESSGIRENEEFCENVVTTPEKRKSPITAPPKIQYESPHRLPMITYSGDPQDIRHDEVFDDDMEGLFGVSDIDEFCENQNSPNHDVRPRVKKRVKRRSKNKDKNKEPDKDSDEESDQESDKASDKEPDMEQDTEQDNGGDEDEGSRSLDEDFIAAEDDEYVRNGVARANFEDFDGVTIDFVDRPQIIEIDMPVANNDDPHQLIVESEETIEYAEAQSENAHMYGDDYDNIDNMRHSQDSETNSAIGNKFPVKFVESTPPDTRLTIADIILRMSQQDIDTSVELSKEIVDIESNAVVATSTKGDVRDGSMMVDEVVSSDSSSISADDENVGSPDDDIHENEVQPFVTTSQFLNASNARQVLVLLKTKIYFHGALSIRLIAGSATIFGYELMQGETIFAYSPRTDNCLFVSPSGQDYLHHQPNSFDINFHHLHNAFGRSELDRLVKDFDKSRDAIVLLESDSNNRSYYMIENYMRETIFANLSSTDDHRHPTQLSESMLRCRFLTHTASGLRVNPQWHDVAMTVNSRQMIIGGKGVGKSTFLRYLINKNLQAFEEILLIDLDIGLPEMFVPQTVSATIISEPILGPGYIRNTHPYKAYLFGDVNVLVSPIKYLKCVLKLLKHCSCRDELRSMPWVINTMGYSHGFGLELIAAILRALNPTDLIQIQSSKSADNVTTILNAEVVNAFSFNIFKNEIQYMQNECTYSTYVCNTMSSERQQEEWNKSQKDLRYAMILSKLGGILQGNVNWVTDVRPFWAYLNQMKVLVLSDDCDNVHSQSSVLNGNLVYLCQSSEHAADEDIVECHGIGIVRSVETANDKIYLLPAISKTELSHVNVIAICNIPLPPALLLNQSSRIGGRIPYVYSTDNFVGSKKNVPNSCRPEKRTSNNHIKLV